MYSRELHIFPHPSRSQDGRAQRVLVDLGRANAHDTSSISLFALLRWVPYQCAALCWEVT